MHEKVETKIWDVKRLYRFDTIQWSEFRHQRCRITSCVVINSSCVNSKILTRHWQTWTPHEFSVTLFLRFNAKQLKESWLYFRIVNCFDEYSLTLMICSDQKIRSSRLIVSSLLRHALYLRYNVSILILSFVFTLFRTSSSAKLSAFKGQRIDSRRTWLNVNGGFTGHRLEAAGRTVNFPT